MLADKEITERIIGAAITVHKALGPGFLETIYEEALAAEFEHAGIRYERQKTVPITYRGKSVGEHRLDFLVEGCVVVELKAIQSLDDIHFAIVRSYLKAVNLHSGLLLNFATMPLTVKRVGREDAARIKSIAEISPTGSPPDFLISKLKL
jgi:GxxExxY protein